MHIPPLTILSRHWPNARLLPYPHVRGVRRSPVTSPTVGFGAAGPSVLAPNFLPASLGPPVTCCGSKGTGEAFKRFTWVSAAASAGRMVSN